MSNIKNISAENCYSTIKENKDAYLVDVRTPYEWETFGRVDEDSFDAQYIELTLINEEAMKTLIFSINSILMEFQKIRKFTLFVSQGQGPCMLL